MLFLPKKELNSEVFCFTTSIQGGVSNDVYQSFNLGDHVGDNSKRVATNRHLLNAIIYQQIVNRNKNAGKSDEQDLAAIKWLPQGHSINIVDYNEVSLLSSGDTSKHYIDGIDTSLSRTPLAIMTADCLPIVLACSQSGKIAAIHAGWRGLIDGILAKALARFEDPSVLNVWIGPHISQDKFEVSMDIIDLFKPYEDAVKVSNRKDKYLVNLAQIACLQLTSLGIKNIEVSSVCTYANNNCFSYRRNTNNGQTQTGRMATVIVKM